MKSYYTNKLIKISFLLLCLMAIIINIHAMDNDEDTVTVSRVKYDTIMNENEIMQNEIARLQNLLKSRKRFREVLPTQSAQLGGEDKPSDEPSEECEPCPRTHPCHGFVVHLIFR